MPYEALLSEQEKLSVNDRLQVYQTVCTPRSATYISGPITTGREYIKWYNKIGSTLDRAIYLQEHRKSVLNKNLEYGRRFVTDLRECLPNIFIEPFNFWVEEWVENQYLYFWTEVIKRYANKVVFLDGWECSLGCISEYYIAVDNNISTLDQYLQPITLDTSVYMIGLGIDYLSSCDKDTKHVLEFHANLKEKQSGKIFAG